MKRRIELIAKVSAAFALLFTFAGCGDDGGGNGDGGDTKYCQPSCESASDCGDESKWACEDGVCKADECESDDECAPSGWDNEGCELDDCDAGYACVKHNDTTYCAIEHNEQSGCAQGEKTEKDNADGSDTVQVCLKASVCQNNFCLPEGSGDGGDGGGGCESDDDCPAGGSCNDDGACVCSDGDCDEGYTCASM